MCSCLAEIRKFAGSPTRLESQTTERTEPSLNTGSKRKVHEESDRNNIPSTDRPAAKRAINILSSAAGACETLISGELPPSYVSIPPVPSWRHGPQPTNTATASAPSGSSPLAQASHKQILILVSSLLLKHYVVNNTHISTLVCRAVVSRRW
jgi:hypothetical protein